MRDKRDYTGFKNLITLTKPPILMAVFLRKYFHLFPLYKKKPRTLIGTGQKLIERDLTVQLFFVILYIVQLVEF